jgi:two-component system, chemotaxis family, chemotaxis protein CheY
MMREEVCILVVDDVNTMRIQVKELLKSCGFKKISLAASGEEAKRVMAIEQFHLIMCDWQMTPTDGLDLLKYARAHPLYKDVAFVMVTAENTKEKVIQAIQSGVDNYLVKPLTPIEIQNKVYGVLLKKQVL